MSIVKDTSIKKSDSFDDFGISTQVFFSDTAIVQRTIERACGKAGKNYVGN